MTETKVAYSTAQKLAIFRRCFSGLPQVYGTYDLRSGRVRQVKEPVTDTVLLHHLQGRQPYGVYLLVGERTTAAVADFDAEDTRPPLEFRSRAAGVGISTYLERSKSKGWHAWMFFEPRGVPAAKARSVVLGLLRQIGGPQIEIFPKHDRLADSTHFGNFINAPLFGRLVPLGRTVFVDPDDDLRPFADQWTLLDQVQRMDERTLDTVIEHPGIGGVENDSGRQETASRALDSSMTFGLPPCGRRMLAEGVVTQQRVACFRLAVQLKKAGAPEDIAAAALAAWAAKNRPVDGKRTITRAEVIAQVHSAYSRSYRSCGCEEPVLQSFCDAGCPLRGAGQGSGSLVPRMDSGG